jgi:hypothetical protein
MGVEGFQQRAAAACGIDERSARARRTSSTRHEHQSAGWLEQLHSSSACPSYRVYCVSTVYRVQCNWRKASNTHIDARYGCQSALVFYTGTCAIALPSALLAAGSYPAGYWTATFTKLSCATRSLPSIHCLRLRARNALHSLELCRTAHHRPPPGPLERSGPARRQSQDGRLRVDLAKLAHGRPRPWRLPA